MVKNRSRLIPSLPMLSVAGIVLFLSYVYSSSILTLIGLGLAFWGSILYYVTSSSYIPKELLSTLASSHSNLMIDIVTRLGYDVKNSSMIFFYPKSLKGLREGHVFIFTNNVKVSDIGSEYREYLKALEVNISDDKIFYDSPKGLLMKASSQSLVSLFEDRLNTDFSSIEIKDLEEKLEKVMVEDLMLVDSFKMSINDNSVEVYMSDKEISKLCSMNINNPSFCTICSAIALAISKSTARAVMIKESIVKDLSVKNIYLLLD